MAPGYFSKNLRMRMEYGSKPFVSWMKARNETMKLKLASNITIK
jgi:hypothetical protein